MKNVFIVLLIAALGAGVYFYFSKKRKIFSSNPKELILGKWKVDSMVDKDTEPAMPRDGLSLALLDSSHSKSEFEFRKDTLFFQSFNGKIKDTSQYEVSADKTLSVWDSTDTAKRNWDIEKLDSAALILKDQDSASFYFQRVKE